MGLCRRTLILSMWVGVEDSVEDKAPHIYQRHFQWIPLQEEGVQIGEVKQSSYQLTMTRGYRESN